MFSLFKERKKRKKECNFLFGRQCTTYIVVYREKQLWSQVLKRVSSGNTHSSILLVLPGFLNWTTHMVEHNENSVPAIAHLQFINSYLTSLPPAPVSGIQLYKVDLYKSAVYSKTQDKAKCMGNMKICQTLNPCTPREIHIDFSGNRSVYDRCLCLNSSAGKWKTLFSSDPGMLVSQKPEKV